MVAAIAPFWDGNETWLVVIGASLFAAFPKVYAVFLPAFYIPVLLLLLGLIFRGVAFEFRYRGARKFWNRGFFLGSAIAAFVQGAAVGAMIRGIPVVDGQYAGGAFEWLAPLPVLCGVGLMLGYALLGAGWLVMKCEGELQEWARQRIPWLAVSVAIVVMTAFQFALLDRDRIATNVHRLGARLADPQFGGHGRSDPLRDFPLRQPAVRANCGVFHRCLFDAGLAVLALHDPLHNHHRQRCRA